MDISTLAISFINLGYAKIYKILLIKLTKLLILRLADNKRVPNITYTTQIKFNLGGYIDEI